MAIARTLSWSFRGLLRCALPILLALVAVKARAQDVNAPAVKEAPPKGRPPAQRPEMCGEQAVLARYYGDGAPDAGRLKETQQRITQFLDGLASPDPGIPALPVVIPVVVHVVLDADPEGRIPKGLVDTQISRLDHEFDGTIDMPEVLLRVCGPSASAAVCPRAALATAPQFHFALANRDPQCHATGGVTWTKTTHGPWKVTTKSVDDGMKFDSSGGDDAWDTRHYLNIWVVDIAKTIGADDDPSAKTVLGVATPPIAGRDPLTDGIIMDWSVFGDLQAYKTATGLDAPIIATGLSSSDYMLGRSTVHEVGHWFDLLHPWGAGDEVNCGDDGLGDTPPQSMHHDFCNVSGFTSTSDTCTTDSLTDLCQDFMDYTHDAERVLFTPEQVGVMQASLFTERAALLGSQGLTGTVDGADAWVTDAWDDLGQEPDHTSEPLWRSPAIWVRHQNDGVQVQTHQDPVFSAGPQFAYVRVCNRGCDTVAEGKLELDWAKASLGLGWPAPWDGSEPGPPPMGGTIGTKTFGPLLAGDSTILEFSWTPPDPADYATFGDDKGHFCLLAHLLSQTPAALVPPPAGVSSLEEVVRNRNDFAWKNLWVYSDILDAKAMAFTMGNPTDGHERTWIRIGGPWRDDLLSLAQLGKLSARLQADPSQEADHIQFLDTGIEPGANGALKIAGTGSILGPIELASGTNRIMRLDLALLKGVDPRNGPFVLNIEQWSGVHGPQRLTGGISIEVPVRPAVAPPEAGGK